MSNPLLICMTPVRNEAWILHAFLKATSLWADYIIIADQGSTDGSREIALSYHKVILVENKNPNFNEAERQKMLIDKAREIEGDKILFGLDADEIFAANFKETEDWQKILNSQPGDVFWFRWAIICPDKEHYWDHQTFFPWMFHDDGKELHSSYVRNIHSMRIPYPIEEKQMYYVTDFRVLHFVSFNVKREIAKRRFYKLVDYLMNNLSIVQLSRMYTFKKSKDDLVLLPQIWIHNPNTNKFDLFEEIDLSDNDFWFDNYIIKQIESNLQKVSKIDIWDKDLLHKYNIVDQRTGLYKLIHWYLKITVNFSNNFLVKLTDKVFKKMSF